MSNKEGVSEGRLLYEQYLGKRPIHRQYEVVAVNRSEEEVDSVVVEFNCFTDISDNK